MSARRALLLPLALCLLATGAAAQLRDWAVVCQAESEGEGMRCQMSQTLLEPGTGETILSLVIRPSPDGAGLSMLMALPHGLDLAAGVRFDIDGADAGAAPFQTSDRNGVYVALPLPEPAVDAMRAGNAFNVRVTTLQGEEAEIPASLLGFTAAVARLAREE
ncbi:hypothetical protein OG2516_13626 [Oceanicola granulosus HTCC2516]|uniref:Uncharacterized protein n=1 Tax=Oceanicola granulosus (strain ATCC BAA-861 / DSM 15982 / KCTC 12143 / HTCC2516) TaxID=314256 RepID=Q2CE22_OCEGH|nr:invasion associated locus B family protein [Oceanicola granulosus]EAR50916.1 hypothetical protein OG2516_13626 [Oceanicola granulosus HTCC2516]